MRLIHTSTFRQEEFYGSEIPPYAILSHTWGEHEVTFQQYRDIEYARSLSAFHKIYHTCRLAALRNLDWAWIDTCCIDKSSSAELSESINSMYTWYQRAAVCFAYLFDLPAGVATDHGNSNDVFGKCRWFTRGWTLQELIAPRSVIFYNSEWTVYGTKDELAERISAIMNIDVGVLRGKRLDHFSIAQRMSWAAHRQTKRVEDIAYCLMGIFGVNMPLLYGEGENAFIRLQEEIMQDSDDSSLLAWRAREGGADDTPSLHVLPDGSQVRGPFASSPAEFADSGNITYRPSLEMGYAPYTMTNKGLYIKRPCIRTEQGEILFLGCGKVNGLRDYKLVGIRIKSLSGGRGVVVRTTPAKLFMLSMHDLWAAVETEVYIRKRFV
ncbi:hypothetical protein ABOM_007290 [Aspergillus bombycis]|uniref:Uncharacterized protein n=1 Tax=Aspergillus bombycis TaxID=109264 RepID=A0A1F7ZYB0_9EURO|nr:hypothetical protein ABOM_007290 [Aspergillus bombycis]OGM44075.1 hypothetical protein ABOM_007290 [Aspergillus bombycis]